MSTKIIDNEINQIFPLEIDSTLKQADKPLSLAKNEETKGY